MNQELHNDGEFTIFKVQVRVNGAGNNWIPWKSLYAHSDRGGTRIPEIGARFETRHHRIRNHESEPLRSFGACGDCWQKTGIHGTFDVGTANDLAHLLLKYNTDLSVRIIKQEISQKTRVWAAAYAKDAR